MQVVAKFAEADLSSINSKAGFFMGIVKRFREQVFADPVINRPFTGYHCLTSISQVAASDPNVTASAFSGLPFVVQTKLEVIHTAFFLFRVMRIKLLSSVETSSPLLVARSQPRHCGGRLSSQHGWLVATSWTPNATWSSASYRSRCRFAACSIDLVQWIG